MSQRSEKDCIVETLDYRLRTDPERVVTTVNLTRTMGTVINFVFLKNEEIHSRVDVLAHTHRYTHSHTAQILTHTHTNNQLQPPHVHTHTNTQTCHYMQQHSNWSGRAAIGSHLRKQATLGLFGRLPPPPPPQENCYEALSESKLFQQGIYIHA